MENSIAGKIRDLGMEVFGGDIECFSSLYELVSELISQVSGILYASLS
jgi:hypothetical protein